MLKVKVLSRKDKRGFEKALEEAINTNGQGSVQYRATVDANGTVVHSACLIYEDFTDPTPKKGE
jgi:hypothetical protein